MAVKKATWSQKSTGDILHPETEVDQLKASGSTALASIITTLLKAATSADARAAIESAAATHQHSSSDIQSFASSVVSAIGDETLQALGVRYSITTNGYICFGQLFGGLILQWGDPAQIVWPIDPETGEEIDHSKAIEISGGGGGGGTVISGDIAEFPIGTIIPYGVNSTTPVGYLECNGQNVSRTEYAKLFEAIGTTYGEGDGSTTFTLPNFNKRFMEGSTTAGTAKEAGLPNIAGSIIATNATQVGGTCSGAFVGSVVGGIQIPDGGTASGLLEVDLDASHSSSVYGKSNTVQPSAVTIRFLIKATSTAVPTDIKYKSYTQNGYIVYNSGLVLYWGDINQISFPAGVDTSNAINISGGSGGGANPIGAVISYAGNGDLPEGYLLCNGNAISRTDYSDLFDVIGTTYGEGDGSTTFNLPNYTDKFLEGAIAAGLVKSAGLPNITGGTSWTAATNVTAPATGALYWNTTGSKAALTNEVGAPAELSFNASRSSNIYGNSDTVQPPAVTVKFLIKARGTSESSSSFDFQPHIYVTARKEGCTVTCTSNGKTASSTVLENGIIDFRIPSFGDWTISCSKDGFTRQDTINVSEIKIYHFTTSNGRLFGFRIYEPEADPYERVEYLYDAVGKTPAHMNYTQGEFDYGDWADVWFIKNNKPCMVKRDGTVDYYLDPNDYSKREDGTASDVSNLSYDGNAMSAIPLCYVHRYSEGDYNYVIVSDIPYDENFKAYAHTNASGEIKDYFYYSCFGGSGNSSMIRSIAGQTRAGSLNATQEIQGCIANGSGWYTHTWSQRSLIKDLLVLIGKSTDGQAVFGGGNAQNASSASAIKQTGTLKDKGQFYGYNNYTNQVKVFHIEAFWGDMWDRVAGLISVNYRIWCKMTPEDSGYRITDTTGYTDTGLNVPSMSASYPITEHCTEFGFFPKAVGGSTSIKYPDACWSASGTMYLICGVGVDSSAGVAGPFGFNVDVAPSDSVWRIGCGLSLI